MKKNIIALLMLTLYFFTLISLDLLRFYDDAIKNTSAILLYISLPPGIIFIINKIYDAISFLMNSEK